MILLLIDISQQRATKNELPKYWRYWSRPILPYSGIYCGVYKPTSGYIQTEGTRGAGLRRFTTVPSVTLRTTRGDYVQHIPSGELCIDIMSSGRKISSSHEKAF
jgi:hypothetical protein